MEVEYGITYKFDRTFIVENIGEVEFEFEGKKYLFDDYNFYVWADDVNDDQESDWQIVQDLELKYLLEPILFETEEVTGFIYETVEDRICKAYNDNEIINKIWKTN